MNGLSEPNHDDDDDVIMQRKNATNAGGTLRIEDVTVRPLDKDDKDDERELQRASKVCLVFV